MGIYIDNYIGDYIRNNIDIYRAVCKVVYIDN